MTAISILLTDEQLNRLAELAHQAGVSPTEIACIGLQGWLNRPRDDIHRRAEYLLEKNAELYRRLA